MADSHEKAKARRTNKAVDVTPLQGGGHRVQVFKPSVAPPVPVDDSGQAQFVSHRRSTWGRRNPREVAEAVATRRIQGIRLLAQNYPEVFYNLVENMRMSDKRFKNWSHEKVASAVAEILQDQAATATDRVYKKAKWYGVTPDLAEHIGDTSKPGS